jgi:hypothetical protein
MPVLATSSFEMYFVEDGKHIYKGSFVPSQGEGKTYVECRLKDKPVMKDIIIYFPINSAVSEFYIGLREGSNLEEGGRYTYETPVVFYGSSIVHGIGAARPGMNYPSQISRILDTNVYNLGFGGGAKGEPAIIDFIADQKMSVFVYDYDHNAPTFEYLRDTHYEGYRIIRSKNPDVPIIMASRPDYWTRNYTLEYYDIAETEKRRSLIEENYRRALAEGDKNVYFVDGSKMYPEELRHECSTDGCHPNDLGYHFMANAFEAVLRPLLEK